MSLPTGYLEIEYIQSTGTQYIDTGVTPNTNTVIKLKLNSQYLGESAIFGSSWALNGYFLMFYQNKVRWHGNPAIESGVVSLNTDIDIETAINNLTVNEIDYPCSGGTPTSYPIRLFSTTIAGAPGASNTKGSYKLYYLKIYNGDTIVRDFVPCLNSQGDVGLYDLVSNSFFGNNGTGEFIPGPAVTPYFTVLFNANGGYGTMEPQDILVDVPTPLRQNAFRRENFAFYGWGYTPDGEVALSDGETVTNLAPAYENTTLYAVWGLPQMEILIQRNNSEKNKLDKEIETVASLSGRLRNETSIIDPVITIAGNLEAIAGANYMTIPTFKRKYFITNIRSIRNGIIEISAHVDVLSSFATEIRTNHAIVHKQENEWNLYLNDGTFKVYSYPLIETYLFPVSFPGTFSYVLAVAGGGGSANE